MLISFSRLKRLAIVAAFILLPFIAINLINLRINNNSTAVIRDTASIEQLPMPVDTSVASKGEAKSFFSEYRIEREKIRGQQIELLNSIANNSNREQKLRDNASLKLVQIADTLAREMQTEALLKARGYKECAVILEPDGLTIILDKEDISEAQKAELSELCSIISGIAREKIIITSYRQVS